MRTIRPFMPKTGIVPAIAPRFAGDLAQKYSLFFGYDGFPLTVLHVKYSQVLGTGDVRNNTYVSQLQTNQTSHFHNQFNTINLHLSQIQKTIRSEQHAFRSLGDLHLQVAGMTSTLQHLQKTAVGKNEDMIRMVTAISEKASSMGQIPEKKTAFIGSAPRTPLPSSSQASVGRPSITGGTVLSIRHPQYALYTLEKNILSSLIYQRDLLQNPQKNNTLFPSGTPLSLPYGTQTAFPLAPTPFSGQVTDAGAAGSFALNPLFPIFRREPRQRTTPSAALPTGQAYSAPFGAPLGTASAPATTFPIFPAPSIPRVDGATATSLQQLWQLSKPTHFTQNFLQKLIDNQQIVNSEAQFLHFFENKYRHEHLRVVEPMTASALENARQEQVSALIYTPYQESTDRFPMDQRHRQGENLDSELVSAIKAKAFAPSLSVQWSTTQSVQIKEEILAQLEKRERPSERPLVIPRALLQPATQPQLAPTEKPVFLREERAILQRERLSDLERLFTLRTVEHMEKQERTILRQELTQLFSHIPLTMHHRTLHTLESALQTNEKNTLLQLQRHNRHLKTHHETLLRQQEQLHTITENNTLHSETTERLQTQRLVLAKSTEHLLRSLRREVIENTRFYREQQRVEQLTTETLPSRQDSRDIYISSTLETAPTQATIPPSSKRGIPPAALRNHLTFTSLWTDGGTLQEAFTLAMQGPMIEESHAYYAMQYLFRAAAEHPNRLQRQGSESSTSTTLLHLEKILRAHPSASHAPSPTGLGSPIPTVAMPPFLGQNPEAIAQPRSAEFFTPAATQLLTALNPHGSALAAPNQMSKALANHLSRLLLLTERRKHETKTLTFSLTSFDTDATLAIEAPMTQSVQRLVLRMQRNAGNFAGKQGTDQSLVENIARIFRQEERHPIPAKQRSPIAQASLSFAGKTSLPTSTEAEPNKNQESTSFFPMEFAFRQEKENSASDIMEIVRDGIPVPHTFTSKFRDDFMPDIDFHRVAAPSAAPQRVKPSAPTAQFTAATAAKQKREMTQVAEDVVTEVLGQNTTINKIAERIYSLLERRLRFEKERRGL